MLSVPQGSPSLSSSNFFFSSFDASFDPLSWVSRDLIIRASMALGPCTPILPSRRSSRSLRLGSTTNALILSVGFPFSHVVKCKCGTIAARLSQVAQRHSHDLCRFSLLDVPSWRRQLHVVFRQMRMISFLSGLAVFPTCYLLHDSRLFGLTLRPSAPVCCCHRVS